MSNLTAMIQERDFALKKLQVEYDDQIGLEMKEGNDIDWEKCLCLCLASYNQQIDDLKDEVDQLRRQARRLRGGGEGG